MRTYADTLLVRRAGSETLLRDAALVLAGSVFLAIAAKVQVPFAPVPVTFQTFAVLLVGAMLGSRLGALTAMAYLLEGLIGLPVFAGPIAGPAYFAGLTAGYLFAVPIAAWMVGRLAERGWDQRFVTSLMALAAGDLIILGLGFAWLSLLIGAEKALATGVAPFWVIEPLKILLVAAALPLGRKWMGRRSPR